MRLILLLCILLIFSETGFGQRMDISAEEKISSSYYNFQVVGKNDLGILIYKHKRDNEYLEIFNSEMALTRRKTFLWGDLKSPKTIRLEISDDKVIHFYSYKGKKKDYLEAQKLNSKLEDVGPPVLLDSADRKISDHDSDYKIRTSKDRKNFLAYKMDLQGGDVQSITSLIFDPFLKVRFRNSLQVAQQDRKKAVLASLINNDGTVFYLLKSDKDKLIKSDNDNVIVYSCKGSGSCERYELEVKGNEISQLRADFDEMNNNLVITGFYSRSSESLISGYVYSMLDIQSKQFTINSFVEFPSALVQEVLGKINIKKNSVPEFEIRDIIIRSDGGLLMVAEYIKETQEAFEYSNYDPYYGYRTSTRYVNFYEYEDIFLLSINPDSSLDWSEFIHKSQVSREDNGRNSSYCLVNSKNELFFLFNEEISYNTNVMKYAFRTGGKFKRDVVFNAEQKELMLIPQMATQISGNEIVVPSIYKNNLTFVKLTF